MLFYAYADISGKVFLIKVEFLENTMLVYILAHKDFE